MKKTFIYLCCIALITLGINACKKTDGGSGTKAVFSYVADGFNVNFTNFSQNASTYSWDFGDQSGETSTKRSPQHIFKSKGDFLVTLTATQGSSVSKFTDTVSIIGPNIKIDGDFSDWQYVDYAYTNTDVVNGGTLLAIKTFASPTDINVYLEGTPAMQFAIMDMYIDADNNAKTGFVTAQYPAGAGAEFLFEGSLVGGWGSLYVHSGDPASFSFSPIFDIADVLHYSAIKSVSGKNVIEFSIPKAKLGTLKTAINLCIVESTSGYAQLGAIPSNNSATSAFLQIKL
ncbi:PKD domain-containing protein [Mucilaginibacter sp. dw_454]|uniref:PKD domain-containing protein n=1 Tax=Mucilaginibacter sp. dw_454 TaxID=2720079 RepID=UPI001BD43B2C|nr:PKD domain-containing protein [Mucilaginibacter sp. dw_454]